MILQYLPSFSFLHLLKNMCTRSSMAQAIFELNKCKKGFQRVLHTILNNFIILNKPLFHPP